MADTSRIREHQEVVGSDGVHIGTVDKVEGDRIRLAARDSNDGRHHYLNTDEVTRVDDKVHVSTTAEAMGLLAVAGATGATADHGSAPFPPIKNRQVEGSRPRGNFYLPWILGLIGLLLLSLLFRSCSREETQTTVVAPPPPIAEAPAAGPALPVEAVALPDGQSIDLSPDTLNYELQRYLASPRPAPRTFTFERLNFDTGSASIRPVDVATVDALARILAAYPDARGRIIGYTDARGSEGANADLGRRRAEAVRDAVVARNVDAARLEAVSGGENDPVDTNATGAGRLENRRTELVITAK